MNTATVLQAGLACHPESGRACLRILVDKPYAAVGADAWATSLWVDPAAPEPASGDQVQWDGRRAQIAGVWWRKLELDGKP